MAGLPDPHVLDAEANLLRPKAAALHQAAVDAMRRDMGVAKEWDRTRGPELAAARKGAEEAQTRVKEQTDRLETTKQFVKATEEEAKEAAKAGRISDAEEATERVARLRVIVETEEKDLEEARIAAVEQDVRARQLEAERESTVRTSNTIEKAADQIDEKIRLLAEGAQKQREAETQRANGDLTGAAESERAAGHFIDKADKLTIDFSKVSPAILDEAGIDPATLNRAPEVSTAGSVDEAGAQQVAGMSSSVDPVLGEEPDAGAQTDPATGIQTAAAAAASEGGEVGDDLAGSQELDESVARLDAQVADTTPQPAAADPGWAEDSGDAFGSAGDPMAASASAATDNTGSSFSDAPDSSAPASFEDDSSFTSQPEFADASSGDSGSGDMELDPNTA